LKIKKAAVKTITIKRIKNEWYPKCSIMLPPIRGKIAGSMFPAPANPV
jgi:hypothetical protein